MANPTNPEDKRKLTIESHWASLCLGMVSVHVTLPKGVQFQCYVMPWECLTRARQFLEIGAVRLSMHGTGFLSEPSFFYWARETPKRTRRGKPRLDFVNQRGE